MRRRSRRLGGEHVRGRARPERLAPPRAPACRTVNETPTCACASIRPGMSVRPPRSIDARALGRALRRRSATRAIAPSSTSTETRSRTRRRCRRRAARSSSQSRPAAGGGSASRDGRRCGTPARYRSPLEPGYGLSTGASARRRRRADGWHDLLGRAVLGLAVAPAAMRAARSRGRRRPRGSRRASRVARASGRARRRARRPGMRRSRIAAPGRRSRVRSSAPSPSAASPTTSCPAAASVRTSSRAGSARCRRRRPRALRRRTR